MKILIQTVVAVGLLAVVYWLGYSTGKAEVERNFLALSAMSDVAKLDFNLGLRKRLVEQSCEGALLVLERKIDSNISVLNSYGELMLGNSGAELKRRLRELLKARKKQGRDIGAIELLISKLGPQDSR